MLVTLAACALPHAIGKVFLEERFDGEPRVDSDPFHPGHLSKAQIKFQCVGTFNVCIY